MTPTRASLLAIVAAFSSGAVASPGADLVVRGATVHTMAGEPIEEGVVVIDDGLIAAVGRESEVTIPEGVRIVSAAVVIPGLIDARSVVGLSGIDNQRQDQDQLEGSEPVQPELRAIDAFNPTDPLVAWVRGFGVTTLHTGHAPGAVISGQTLLAKTAGGANGGARVLVARAMVAATLGEGALAEGGEQKVPGTRSKAVALLRQQLLDARAYAERRERSAGDDEGPREGRNLRHEALARVLDGQMPLLVTAHRHHDISAALRLAKEFDVRLVLDGAAESYVVLDEIAAARAPVLIHPTMKRAYGEAENLAFDTASNLAEAGIPLALQSGYESYVPKTRVVLFEAAVAAANGLGRERALESITIGAARILGIDDQIGSLEPGKAADVALFDGDPFEYTSHCVGVIVDGDLVSEESR